MAITESEFELMIKYFEEDLDDKGQELFDELMKRSSMFREEVQMTEQIICSIKALARAEKKEKLKDVFAYFEKEELRKEIIVKPVGLLKMIFILFLLLILISLSFMFYYS